MLLEDIFIHDNGGGNAHIETFHAPKLGNPQTANFGVIDRIETDAEIFVTQNESALCRKVRLAECCAAVSFEGKQGITLLSQLVMTRLKAFMEVGRHLAKGALGRGGIKGCHVDQVDFPGAEGFRAAKDLGDIKACLEMIQRQDVIRHTRRGRLIQPLYLLIPHIFYVNCGVFLLS